MKVLMLGVDRSRKGGMWTVVENYLNDKDFCHRTGLCYIPTVSKGSTPRRMLDFIKAYLQMRKELRTGNYDIVHMHLSERGSLYRKGIFQGLAKKAGCVSVIHMHGGDFHKWYETNSESRKKYIRKVLSGADNMLILGHFWQDVIGSLMDDPGRITVLYNAVQVPEENLYNPQAVNIMFLGMLFRTKGIFELLQAMDIIRDKLPAGCKLILCGDDPDGIVEPEIRRLRLQSLVEMKGWADMRQKEEVMSQSAVNVLPSHHEGLPMTVLETMAYGIPNVATNVCAIPEAVTHGTDGLLIEPGDVNALADALLKLLGNPELRTEYSAHAYKRIREDFSFETHKRQLLSIYEGLLSTKAK